MGIDGWGIAFSLRLVIYGLVAMNALAAVVLLATALKKSNHLFTFYNKSSRRFKAGFAVVNAAAILYFIALIFLGYFPQLFVQAEVGGILMLAVFLFDMIVFLI